MVAPTNAAIAVVASLALIACGNASDPKAATGASDAAAPATSSATGDAGTSANVADAAPAAPARPFASSPLEATQLIGAAIDGRAPAMKKCVADYRVRKKLPHERVEITVGIDQEGRLLGATLKNGKKDGPFSDCVQKALEDAPFPRSHAGVIQATKSYEEIEQ